MSERMDPYVVRQGDYLLKLAHRYGFDAEEVWSHPRNEDLRELRRDHNILAPGDIIYLPVKAKDELPITKGAENRYSATVPRASVNLRFDGVEGPLAGARFVVDGGATPSEGTTDSDGRIELTVPVHVAELRVTFPDQGKVYSVRVGHLDPITERSGVASRLAHLGFLPPAEMDEHYARIPGFGDKDARITHAVRAFQGAHGLPPTGVVDDATRDALVAAHGS